MKACRVPNYLVAAVPFLAGFDRHTRAISHSSAFTSIPSLLRPEWAGSRAKPRSGRRSRPLTPPTRAETIRASRRSSAKIAQPGVRLTVDPWRKRPKRRLRNYARLDKAGVVEQRLNGSTRSAAVRLVRRAVRPARRAACLARRALASRGTRRNSRGAPLAWRGERRALRGRPLAWLGEGSPHGANRAPRQTNGRPTSAAPDRPAGKPGPLRPNLPDARLRRPGAEKGAFDVSYPAPPPRGHRRQTGKPHAAATRRQDSPGQPLAKASTADRARGLRVWDRPSDTGNNSLEDERRATSEVIEETARRLRTMLGGEPLGEEMQTCQ